jgi:hydrogenase maturation protease
MTRPKRKPRILVAGLGNVLLRDDGVGVHACRRLAEIRKRRCPPWPAGSYHPLLAEVGIAVSDALHLLQWADHILAMDAMQAGGAPGTVYLAEADEVSVEPVQAGLHQLSLLGALRLIDRPARKPPIRRLLFLGVEPEVIDFGMDLSHQVEAALGSVVEKACSILQEWGQTDASNGRRRSLVRTG